MPLKVAIVMMPLVAAMAADEPGGPAPQPETPAVTGIKAVCRNGQTFVTWRDVAEGEAGAAYRYALYRSDRPITHDNLAEAELCYQGVPNNSAKLFGYAYWMKDRLNPATPAFNVWEEGKLVKKAMPTFILEEGGEPLPMWSGVAVRTVLKNGRSHYAVVATDEKGTALSRVEPGESATTDPVDEKVAPIQPIKQADSKVRGQYARSTSITGKQGLPLTLNLHGSQASGGGADDHGDLYVYFGTPEMGWRDGLPGIFTVRENHTVPALSLAPRDAIENPSGNGVIETCWFGYLAVPVGADHTEPRAYPFTERRLHWMINWVIQRYGADPNRVYSAGQSMGGMGSTHFSFRHPELFAAVYPRLGRIRQSWLPSAAPGLPTSIHKGRWDKPVPMADSDLDYWTRMDAVKWVSERHEDLPFYAWCFGRQDTVDPWPSQLEMVKALTANRHGFAFSWNNEGHSSAGGAAMNILTKYYPSSKFARNRSYPAFGNSSIDSNFGNGDRNDGDLVGGINLGFDWSDVVDEPDRWSVKLSNDLAQAEMTVDVTPRRCQEFKPKAGQSFRWTNTAGGAGEVQADQWGLVTVEKVAIKPGQATVLTIVRLGAPVAQTPPTGKDPSEGTRPAPGEATSPPADRPRPEAPDGTSGIRGQVVKLVGDFMPGTEPATGRRLPLAVPVHVFRGRVQPIDKPDPRHPALVKIVQADKDGRFSLALPAGEYTAVAEIDGKLYLNNWLDDGRWATVTVRPGQWTPFAIEDVSDATF